MGILYSRVVETRKYISNLSSTGWCLLCWTLEREKEKGHLSREAIIPPPPSHLFSCTERTCFSSKNIPLPENIEIPVSFFTLSICQARPSDTSFSPRFSFLRPSSRPSLLPARPFPKGRRFFSRRCVTRLLTRGSTCFQSASERGLRQMDLIFLKGAPMPRPMHGYDRLSLTHLYMTTSMTKRKTKSGWTKSFPRSGVFYYHRAKLLDTFFSL